MAKKVSNSHSSSFASSCARRADAWLACESIGTLTPEALASADIMAGYAENIRQKAGSSSRAQMERIAQTAFKMAEVIHDNRQFALENMTSLALKT